MRYSDRRAPRRMMQQMMNKVLVGKLVTVVITLLLLGWFISSVRRNSTADVNSSQGYAILIDAGSSGSRLHVHKYTFHGSSEIPSVEPSLNLKQKPGLSSYSQEPHKAAESLRDLKAFAQKTVPERDWAQTPLLLHATAGLRSIPGNESERILASVREELSTWGFKFQPEWARIISGSEEGLFGFIGVNLLRGVFKPGMKEEDTYGVVEMGGASLQVTFCPSLDKLTAQEKAQLFPVTLGSSTVLVYTYSYLGYGLEKAIQSTRTVSFAQIEASGNPCVLKASQHSGTGNFPECREMIDKALFHSAHKCAACGFVGNFQPDIRGKRLFAIENFYYTPSFFGIDGNSLSALEKKGSEWCGLPYETVKKQDLTAGDINKYCFSSAYIPAVLLALGLSPDEVEKNVVVAKSINGTSIDWALGAVASFILGAGAPREAPQSYPYWLGLLVLLSAVLVVAYRRFRASKSRTSALYNLV